MPLKIFFGPEPDDVAEFDEQLVHDEECIRSFACAQDFDDLALVFVVIRGRETAIRGRMMNQMYHAYTQTHPRVSNDAEMNVVRHEEVEMEVIDVPAAELQFLGLKETDGMTKAESTTMELEDPFNDDDPATAQNLKNHTDDYDSPEQDQALVPKLEDNDHRPFARIKKESKIEPNLNGVRKVKPNKVLDLIGHMNSNKEGLRLLERLRKGAIVADNLWRPRLVKYLGRITMNNAKKLHYPTVADSTAILTQLTVAGHDIGSISGWTNNHSGYMTRHYINKRKKMVEDGELPNLERKNKETSLSIGGLGNSELNERLQTIPNGERESNALMESTRRWRIKFGRENIREAVGSIRQLIDWPAMHIDDVKAEFGVDVVVWEKSIGLISKLVIRAVQQKLPAAIISSLPSEDLDDLHSMLIRVSALLQSISARPKKTDTLSGIYRQFLGSVTLADAMLEVGKVKAPRGKKHNASVQPSLFCVRGTHFINLCGREINVGGNEERGIFILLALYHVYDLSYPAHLADLYSFIEIAMRYPDRKTVSRTASTLYDYLKTVRN